MNTAFAEPRIGKSDLTKSVTCSGTLEFGSLDSGIGDCTVIMKSDAAAAIFKQCKGGDHCAVDAIVDEPYQIIRKVLNVTKD